MEALLVDRPCSVEVVIDILIEVEVKVEVVVVVDIEVEEEAGRGRGNPRNAIYHDMPGIQFEDISLPHLLIYKNSINAVNVDK